MNVISFAVPLCCRSPPRAPISKSATACDVALRLMGGCLPDFSGWSGYPSIAARSISRRIDVMGQQPPLAPQQVRQQQSPHAPFGDAGKGCSVNQGLPGTCRSLFFRQQHWGRRQPLQMPNIYVLCANVSNPAKPGMENTMSRRTALVLTTGLLCSGVALFAAGVVGSDMAMAQTPATGHGHHHARYPRRAVPNQGPHAIFKSSGRKRHALSHRRRRWRDAPHRAGGLRLPQSRQDFHHASA
jgi:hypothetical protein